jgi:hypothetical protein
MLRILMFSVLAPISFWIRTSKAQHNFVVVKVLLAYASSVVIHFRLVLHPLLIFEESLGGPFLRDKRLPWKIDEATSPSYITEPLLHKRSSGHKRYSSRRSGSRTVCGLRRERLLCMTLNKDVDRALQLRWRCKKNTTVILEKKLLIADSFFTTSSIGCKKS